MIHLKIRRFCPRVGVHLKGKTSWEIAKLLGITERTTIFHLNNTTKKLGAINWQHAVAKALMLNIVKPRLYRNS
ncbi:helix-turn-helix domain-containing protein [Acidiferrobacter thiooxydans]|jgi:LuxR family transcriptional activator of bioluminescence operon|uniref:LuxR family transcriptional regulator n=1 Tax=Acidiferrobacter thiooxydans TaxID=163359 RepID=A0A1C2FXF0_9GAMM|nr:LuxR family transcriptional regulator [Acidiferrobacter thiooxydans]UEN98525.1 helix-turn-helix transcriptional regulator [Acidiferrobacter thiooxydans]